MQSSENRSQILARARSRVPRAGRDRWLRGCRDTLPARRVRGQAQLPVLAGSGSSAPELSMALAAQLAVQPQTRGGPLALHRRRRDVQHLRGIFDRETPKKAQFDNLRLLLVEAGEFVQHIVERDDIQVLFL